MSIHPSLKIDAAGAQERTVLTRIERIKDLMKKGLWQEGQSIFALPKTKIVRLKTKKAKPKAEETPEGAEGEKTEAQGEAKVPAEESKS